MSLGMEQLAEQIDRLDNFAAGLELPLPEHLHLQAMRDGLPEIVTELKNAFITAGGDDYWSLDA
ncbi:MULTISPECIES: hypothetical protein [Pseudomonas]|uniref:Uncharacterized protein n=1 Tax=Pseudomonas kuykendallii TaxID=1007099 RepID=A0A2W5D839_9PSED|nr:MULTISPECIES: hypothetical protein [Pseudomonas]PZP26678.1 MAG: hypothetical protein DI599_00530 [Pseudomonas kuykendallii]